MIGTLDIKVNAAHPNMPLSPVYTFLGSPQQVRIINVPKQIGNWKITAVQITVNYPDNSSPSVEATLVGGCWSATLPAPSAVGQSLMGFKITASGVDEHGDPITGYVLGKGHAYVLDDDTTITVGGMTYYVHLVDTTPEAPHKGDLDLSTMKLWNGSAWVSLGGITSVSWGDITNKPSTFPPSAHAHTNDSWFTTAIEAVKSWVTASFATRGHGHYITDVDGLENSLTQITTLATNAGGLAAEVKNEDLPLKLDKTGGTATGLSVVEPLTIEASTGGNSAVLSVGSTDGVLYISGVSDLNVDSATRTLNEIDSKLDELDDGKSNISDFSLTNPANYVSALFSSANSALMGVVRYAFNSDGTIKDRAINAITYAGGALPNFPAQVSGYARDFLLNVTATATASDITLPESGATSVGDALAFTAGKTYLVAITEIAAKHYYIRIIDTTPAN